MTKIDGFTTLTFNFMTFLQYEKKNFIKVFVIYNTVFFLYTKEFFMMSTPRVIVSQYPAIQY